METPPQLNPSSHPVLYVPSTLPSISAGSSSRHPSHTRTLLTIDEEIMESSLHPEIAGRHYNHDQRCLDHSSTVANKVEMEADFGTGEMLRNLVTRNVGLRVEGKRFAVVDEEEFPGLFMSECYDTSTAGPSTPSLVF